MHMGLLKPRDRFRELRNSLRHEIHYLAQIDVEGRPAPLTCIIWDISASGAKLTVADEQHVPDEFTLVLRRHCRVVRRYDGQIGVQFVAA
jgi:PilZ domain